MGEKYLGNNTKDGNNNKSEKRINILVVGDWIIDEDWVMMPERSETSAKQSDEKHFHTAFDDLNVATKRLCGASLTASAIKGYLKAKEIKGANVFGMGVWHPEDDDYLEQLFQEDALQGSNPFQISKPKKISTKRKGKNLFNLAREKDICATTRVVRTFIGHQGTLPKSMSRYDWHLGWKPSSKERPLKDIIDQRVKENLDEMKDRGVILDAIVLADFNKGLITDELISSLTERIKELKSDNGLIWLYRSKQLTPPKWYIDFRKKIEKNDRFIQFIDPRMAKKYAEGKPFTFGAGITSDGLEFLKKYNPKVIKYKMAVLFHDNSCVSYDAEENNLWVLFSNEKPSYLTRGRSSIFLASMVITELAKEKKYLIDSNQRYNFGQSCSIALSNGIQWCNDCLAIWKKGKKVMQVSADIKEAIRFTEPGSNVFVSGPFSGSEVSTEWEQAKEKENCCCILKKSEKPDDKEEDLRLEVWRAHTILNDYTVIDDDRKKSVLNLVNTIQTFLEFEDKDKKRPLISLVKAGPGSGKTFLAKCLAKHFRLELFVCNVAQLTGLEGLIHFFDQVDTAQREGREIFMFLDEVDSMVDGESAFAFLLELMWCGQYYRNGMKNTLKPFPGIFAMSRDSKSDDFKKNHPKFPDLRSRVYGINCELKNFTAIESVYLFAKLLDKYFGQIAYVEKGVLKTISNTKLKYGPRSLELLISLFKEIKRDRVTIENLPDEERILELEEHFPGRLRKPDPYEQEEEKMVKLIYTPPIRK